jgi:hypothetical protein
VSQADPFSDFRAAVARHYTPVAADFGLGQPAERVLYPEIYIEFAARARQLVVSLELGSGPWVEVRVSSLRRRDDGFGLHTLEEDVEGACDSTEAVSRLPTVDAQVSALADLTRRYAANLLKGDFDRVPVLRQLRAKEHRTRNLRMTGTMSGAAPVDHPPTLPELFANAGGTEFPADARLFAVYQAAWDHGYSVPEIAAFLHIAPLEIQRVLDALDNVADDPPDLKALRSTWKRL